MFNVIVILIFWIKKFRIWETQTFLLCANSSKQKLKQTPIYGSHSPQAKFGVGNNFRFI